MLICIGKISDYAARLISATNKAMFCAIAQCYPGNRLSNMSHVIQATVESVGYSVVSSFGGVSSL